MVYFLQRWVLCNLLLVFSITTPAQDKNNAWKERLSKISTNKSLVFLGEPDHSYGNVFKWKLSFVQHLIEKENFDGIIFESGYIDFMALNDLKKSNNFKTLLYSSLFPIWTSSSEFTSVINYITENDIEVHGMDCQFSGSLAVEYLVCQIENTLKIDGTEIYNLWNELSHFDLETKTELKNCLNKNENILKQLDNIESDQSELKYSISLISDYIKYLISLPKVNLTEQEFTAAYANGRDELMAQNISKIIEANPEKRFIVWTANVHALKYSDSLQNEELSSFKSIFNQLPDDIKSLSSSIAVTGVDTIIVNSKKSIEFGYNANYEAPNFITFAEPTWSTVLSPSQDPVFGNWKTAFDEVFHIKILTPSTPYIPELAETVQVCELNEGIQSKPSITESSKVSVQSINLKEVEIIKNLSSKQIIKKVISNYEKNYTQSAFSQFLYVENEYSFIETGLNIKNRVVIKKHHAEGYRQSSQFPFRYRGFSKVLASEVKRDGDSTYSKAKEFFGGFGAQYDLLENSFSNFLNKRNVKKYDFILLDKVLVNNVLHYKIGFKIDKPKYSNAGNIPGINKFSGELLIDSKTFGLKEYSFNTSEVSFSGTDTTAINGNIKYDYKSEKIFINEIKLNIPSAKGKLKPKSVLVSSLGVLIGSEEKTESSLINVNFENDTDLEEIKNNLLQQKL